MKIYSLRWSIGMGWQNILEKDCPIQDVQAWLDILRDDEPMIDFIISDKKLPKIAKPRVVRA